MECCALDSSLSVHCFLTRWIVGKKLEDCYCCGERDIEYNLIHTRWRKFCLSRNLKQNEGKFN